MAKEKKLTGSSVFIEIGLDWFKILQFEQSSKGIQLVRMCLEKFDVVGSALSNAISNALKKNKFPKGAVVSCLPRQVVNIRLLELPSVDPDEIDDMVGFQAGKQTPYSRDEIVYDYKITGGGREGYTSVILVIVQRSILRQKYSVLEEAGVDIERMSVSSEGLLNWYSHALARQQKEPGAVVMVDVDTFYSDFMVVLNGMPVFTRSILIGADQLMEDYDAASDKFVREVEQSLEICRGESPNLEIGSMRLSGAAPRIQGMAEMLSEQLHLPVKNRDCLHDINKLPASPSFSDDKYSAVSITPLVGMALAPDDLAFNLVPDSVRLRKELVTNAKALTGFGVLLMLLLVCFSLYFTSRLFFEENRLNVLSSMLADTSSGAQEVARQSEIVEVARRRKAVDFTAFNLLSEIHAQIPEGVYFEEIDINTDESKIVLSGSTESRGDVRTIVQQMEKSKLFESVQSGQSAKADDRYVFQITCSLERSNDSK